jgi:hypothetical protein
MRIEIIKTRNGFRIPQMEEMGLPSGRFYAELDLSQFVKSPEEHSHKSKTIAAIEVTLMKLGQNDLLKLKLKHLPKNFTFVEIDSDETVLQQALVKKYGN